jgi:hypothetical protein
MESKETSSMLAEKGREPASAVARSFLHSLARADHARAPFDYWLLDSVLPADDIDALLALPFAPPQGAVFNGKRDTNNSTRVYFTREHQERFPVCRRIAEGLNDPEVRLAIEKTTGADLSDGHLRIEYCQDAPGFWLEPHTDILVKKFTMLVYLSDDPRLRMAGTDIHEGPPDFEYVTSAPYGRNLGLIFIPAHNTWHGVGRHPIEGLRKSLIVNFVTSEWRDKWELA